MVVARVRPVLESSLEDCNWDRLGNSCQSFECTRLSPFFWFLWIRIRFGIILRVLDFKRVDGSRIPIYAAKPYNLNCFDIWQAWILRGSRGIRPCGHRRSQDHRLLYQDICQIFLNGRTLFQSQLQKDEKWPIRSFFLLHFLNNLRKDMVSNTILYTWDALTFWWRHLYGQTWLRPKLYT